MFHHKLLDRLPAYKDIVPVYAVIAFMIYSWSIVSYFKMLSGWTAFLNVKEILATSYYVLSACFLESFSLLGWLLFLCAVLPQSLLRDKFVVRGATTALVSLLSLMVYWIVFYPEYLFFSVVVIFALTLIASMLVTRIPFLQIGIVWISDRLTVFLYLYLPISFLAMVAIIFRNISSWF